MKIFVFALCVSFVLADIDLILSDAGEKFAEDFTAIGEAFQNDSFVAGKMLGVMIMVHGLKAKDKNYTLTLQGVKDSLAKLEEISPEQKESLQTVLDSYKTLEELLSTRLPAERYSNIINMVRVCSNPDSTSEEIQKVLDYYYETKPTEATPIQTQINAGQSSSNVSAKEGA